MKIAIIDYGMGNIHSVAKALAIFGADAVITNKSSEISLCDKSILPWVGAFDDAMVELEKQGLVGAINNEIKQKKPLLGICLGLQLFFEASSEASLKKGLGLIKGQVVKFHSDKGLKVPHMGWNGLNIIKNDCPLLKGIGTGSQVYFCHSYYPEPDQKDVVAASTDYGLEFASVVWKDNIYGVQFHPEKSQETGLKIIKNFIELC